MTAALQASCVVMPGYVVYSFWAALVFFCQLLFTSALFKVAVWALVLSGVLMETSTREAIGRKIVMNGNDDEL